MSDIDQLIIECMKRIDANEEVDREAFLASHPDCADELRDYFESVDEVERMAGPLVASTVKNCNRAAETHVTSVGDSVSEKPARRTLSADKATADSLPETFGRYRIEKQLGRGAMGAVYLAHDTQLDRRVALKTPTFEATADGEMIERFYREARAAANLRHTGICPIFDVGKIDDTHYISMAYIEGKPMSALVGANKPLPIRSVVSLVRKIAMALDHAHSQGVIHRDLKPANIMIDKQKQPLIMDFGLARRVDKHEQTRLTQDGMILGTPAYMSPEQVQGKLESGKQSDVYSLGVILYELLTGDLPFRGTVAAVIGQIMTQDAPPPSKERAEIDPALDAICQKMMARKLEDRYAGTKEVADALTDYLKGNKIRNPASLRSRVSPDSPRQTVTADEGLAEFLGAASQDEFPAVKTRRDGTLTQLVAPWKKLPPRTKVIATSALAGLLLMLSVVFMLRTREGSVRLEIIGDADVEVLIDGQTVELHDGKWNGDKTEGEHRLALKLQGVEIPFDEKSKQFVFGDGEVTVKIAGVAVSSKQRFNVTRDGKTQVTLDVIRAGEVPPANLSDHGSRAGTETAKLEPAAVNAAAGAVGDIPAAAPVPDTNPVHVFKGHKARVMRVVFSPDGSLLASGSNGNHVVKRVKNCGPDNSVRIWRVDSRKQIRHFDFTRPKIYGVQALCISRDGEYVVACGSWDWPHSWMSTTVYLWKISSGDTRRSFKVGKQILLRAVTFSDDNSTLSVAHADNQVVSWNNASELSSMQDEPASVIDLQSAAGGSAADKRTHFTLSFSPDGKLLVGGDKSGNVLVWNTSDGTEVAKLSGHTKPLTAAAISPDGRYVLSCANDYSVRIRDLDTRQEVFRLDALDSKAVCAEFSPNGRSFLTGSEDGGVSLYDVSSGRKIVRFAGHEGRVNSVAFSPTSRFAASGGKDTMVKLWRLPD